MNNKLRKEKEQVDWSNQDSVVSFYESNQLYFDNYEIHSSLEVIEEIAEIKISYIIALDTKKHFKKADKVLRHVDVLIQKLKGSDSIDKLNENYMYASGVIAHRLKHFEESQSYFKQLLDIDPDNDWYKNWYSANKLWLFYQKSKIVGYVGLGLYIVNMIGPKVYNYDKVIENRIEIFAIILMVLGFFAPQLDKFIKKVFKTQK